MKYDDASWHYGGDFPEDLDNDAAATHIAMFVAWCMLNGLGNEDFLEEEPDFIDDLNNRENTPGQWFINNCDEKFVAAELNDEGNAFAQDFYAPDDSPYFDLYDETLTVGLDNLYAVPDTWESYDKLAPKITEAFKKWSEGR